MYVKYRPVVLIILVVACACAPLFFSSADTGKASGTDFVKDNIAIVNELRDMVRDTMEKDGIPGVTLALTDDREILWAESFGYRDGSRRSPVDTDTVFSVQSMSKTITATAVMKAVQDGLLDLDKPITAYLPGFTVNSVFEDRPEEKITLRHLLSCTAGFTHEAPVGGNFDSDASSFEDHIRSISDTWLRFPVGENYGYSNLGIDLAGYILQKASGEKFSRYVEENILIPAGMSNSSFDMGKIKLSSNRAVGQSSFFWRLPLEIPMIPSGGFYSSAGDLAKLIRLHLNRGMVDGRQLIDRKLMDEMYEIPFPASGQTEGYALGLVKYGRNNTYYINHNGGGYGFSTSMIWYPELKVGITVLTNSDDVPEGYISPFNLAQSILDRLIGGTTVFRAGGDSADKSAIPVSSVSDSDIENNLVNNVAQRLASIGDKPAYSKYRWSKYTGQYTERINGIPFITSLDTVSEKDGALYFNNFRLTEVQTGLFFTNEGEALDFRSGKPTFRNIELVKPPLGLGLAGGYTALCALVFIATFILWPLVGLIRLVRCNSKSAAASGKGAGIAAKILQAVNSGLFILQLGTIMYFLILMTKYASSSVNLRDYELLRCIAAVLKFASPAVLILVPVLAAFTLLAWKGKYWSRLERIYYSCVSCLGISFIVFIYHWNVLLLW